ncbi:hypothetical protein [Campylobacter ureolyticus]|uniref:hypothetical protein n=1 Tax=Campylobacter ureolyticus TaxID=827 RepID=UPI0022B36D4B|nr:hypothetical protein [Campylobacter ureolyticus]MCZ6116995.1 hypothetical protein [Campylobacter ureolyticus]
MIGNIVAILFLISVFLVICSIIYMLFIGPLIILFDFFTPGKGHKYEKPTPLDIKL